MPSAIGAVEGTYYFDASDAGPTDASAVWTDDAQAFNGVFTNAASTAGAGDLIGTGTTAPASGADILGVRARFYGASGDPNDWVLLTIPSGGWTWAKVQALHVQYESHISVTSDQVRVYETASLGQELAILHSEIEGTWNCYGVELQVMSDDGRSLLIMASGDDNDIIWSIPTNFNRFFEVNSGAGDDASAGAWYALASDVTTATVALVRTGSEEQSGVMLVVQGADTTTFRDLHFVTNTHFISTLDVDGSPDIQPKAITTVTDGAVVIIQDGVRSWAEIDTDTIVPPSGYTMEDLGTGGTAAENAAPGRVWSGLGNGDAQTMWMHKTVATAGTDSPGKITGITGSNDHKTVTFAIRPAAAVTDYTETIPDDVDVTDAVEYNKIGAAEVTIRPVSDHAAVGWDTAPTASQTLWSQLDEVTPSDTDYIFSEDGS